MPAEIEAMAAMLVASGWSFEIEKLTDLNMIHADCCDSEEQLASFVRPDGPEIPKHVEELVRRAHARWIERDRPIANVAPDTRSPMTRCEDETAGTGWDDEDDFGRALEENGGTLRGSLRAAQAIAAEELKKP